MAATKSQLPTMILLAGEFPPKPGGVADYTQSLAIHLATVGATVHVIAPGSESHAPDSSRPYELHAIPSRFGIGSLGGVSAILRSIPGPRVLILQYVSQSFGYKAVNLPFAWWVYRQRNRLPIWTMFHELEIPYEAGQSAKLRAAAFLTHRMAALIIRASQRLMVSTELWTPPLLAHDPKRKTEWFPVPSNVATTADPQAVAALRHAFGWSVADRVVGHFGTYGPHIAPLLEKTLSAIHAAAPEGKILLMGRGAEDFARGFVKTQPEMEQLISARGDVSAAEVATHLLACDVLVQPYAEGATTRRGSLMAGMGVGRAIVTTSGRNLEPTFKTTDALKIVPAEPAALGAAVAELLNNPGVAADLAARAHALYRAEFAMECTVRRLLAGLPGAQP
jgi:glycosyltransferase involved in cell wall biosynthesis